MINETYPMSFTYKVTDDRMWATLASPLVILITYFVLAIETRELFKPKVCTHDNNIYCILMRFLYSTNHMISDLYAYETKFPIGSLLRFFFNAQFALNYLSMPE